MDFLSLLQNLQNNNQIANDATTQLVDRARMATNPNLAGPSLPDAPTPEENKYSQAIGQGIMGIAAPVKKLPLTNIPSGPGMVQAGSDMWKQMLETQVKNREMDALNRAKMQALKKLSGGQ